MLNKVADFIAKHQLLTHDGLHVVALSGGADSVALLRILCNLGYRVEAAHCNFRLRGEESDRDEQFVRQLAERYGVSYAALKRANPWLRSDKITNKARKTYSIEIPR